MLFSDTKSYLGNLAIVAGLSIATIACTLTPAKAEKPPDTVRVSVVNNSRKLLKAIYMSPPSKDTWGPNELESPIPDREIAEFEWKRSDFQGQEAGCVFDVRAEYGDNTSTDLDQINLCKTPSINLK